MLDHSYHSAHPKHVFSGVVYSQCLRLRRIINSQARLEIRLAELCEAFEKSCYPKKMLSSISTKVLNMERSLTPSQPNESDDTKPILVVSCFGTDEKLVKTLKSYEDDLSKTNSFRSAVKPLFQFVKKTCPNIGSKLSVLKSIALGRKVGTTVPCNAHTNCKCCQLIGDQPFSEVNGHRVSCAPGSCKTKKYNLLIFVQIVFQSVLW